MSKMSHRNIVSLIGVCNKPLSMILEYCNGGNLFNWLRDESRNKEINQEDFLEREKFALDIAKGMQYLHSTTPPIIHRDLKSPNILLSADPNSKYLVAKIADFGLSRGLIWSNHYEGKVVDNPVWLAPEILKRERYNEKVDVYAFGVIMWELISGKIFFEQVKFFTKIEEQILSGIREPFPDNPNIPSYYQKLCTTCWDEFPNVRPSFEKCVNTIEYRGQDSIYLLDESFFESIDPKQTSFINSDNKGKERSKRNSNIVLGNSRGTNT